MAKPKMKTMTISSLEDMVNLVNINSDIFNTLIRKSLRKGRAAKIFGLAALAGSVYTVMKYRKQEEELYRLSIRLKKLENKEGE